MADSVVDSQKMSATTALSQEKDSQQHPTKRPTPNRKKQKAGHRAKHRLRSIHRDVKAMDDLRRQSTTGLVAHALSHWKLIPNERCGSWYTPPTTPTSYFKSTDGHCKFWDFSLKRLNLQLLEQSLVVDGGCVLVDSSVRKLLPDSFSKTISIWATVLNRFVLKYRDIPTTTTWDTRLHTPKGIVSQDEHDKIAGLIDERVETLLRSGAIVNPPKLVQELTKPLRVVWMNHEGELYASNGDDDDDDDETSENYADLVKHYFVIVCWNPSQYQRKSTVEAENEPLIALKKHQTEWIVENDNENAEAGYYYTPGAADDHESWAKHLTPALFRKNQEALLNPALDDDQVDALIDVLVQQENNAQEETEHAGNTAMELVYSYSNQIGDTNLWIGSRRASRPPECWAGFDAILNVTNQEYDDMKHPDRFYLQLPVEEGKRDRTQLEKWMPVGLSFLIHHLQKKRRVLVHCAQGKDRSVAVALVFVTMACPLRFPLKFKHEFTNQFWDLSTLVGTDLEGDPQEKETLETQFYGSSGLPDAIVKRLLDADGREVFLLWVHQQLQHEELQCLADKEGVRIALHLIKQDREVAEPTRNTMQKINRFLMSSSIYR